MAWKQESVSSSEKYSIKASFQLLLTTLLVWTIVFLLSKSCFHVLPPILATSLPVKPKTVASFVCPSVYKHLGFYVATCLPKTYMSQSRSVVFASPHIYIRFEIFEPPSTKPVEVRLVTQDGIISSQRGFQQSQAMASLLRCPRQR